MNEVTNDVTKDCVAEGDMEMYLQKQSAHIDFEIPTDVFVQDIYTHVKLRREQITVKICGKIYMGGYI